MIFFDLDGALLIHSVACLIIVMAILVLIPENGLKDVNTPYAFSSAGFYDKYITP